MKIVDLAERIVHLSGLTVKSNANPQGDIEITFTGLRPGEKLYEELLIGDNVLPTAHSMIMRANEERLPWRQLTLGLDAIIHAIKNGDYLAVREVLKLLVSGYEPDERLVDFIYLQRNRDEVAGEASVRP